MGRAVETILDRKLGRSRVRLVRGDCLAVLSELEPASVDVIVTSPPYNIGVSYSRYDDRLKREEYLAWLDRWGEAVARVLHPEGSLFLNLGGKPSDPWVPFQALAAVVGVPVAAAHRGGRFRLQNTIHWVKSIAIDRELAGSGVLDRDIAVGHYKPVNSDRYLNDCHEYVFHLTKTGRVRLERLALGVAYQDPSNIGRWQQAAGGRHCRGNTWFLPYETIRSRAQERPHPASFPPRLVEWCVRLHGLRRTRLLVDPFVGIGSAAVAACRLGVSFLGIDLDPEYLAVARRRVLAERGLFGS